MKPEQLAKLPKFVRDEIEQLSRQRDEAIRRLNEMTDNQTPSPFYIDEFNCTSSPPEFRKVYFQTPNRMKILHAGVMLQLVLRDREIDLQWSDNRRMMSDICCRPGSYQQIALLTKENMR